MVSPLNVTTAHLLALAHLGGGVLVDLRLRPAASEHAPHGGVLLLLGVVDRFLRRAPAGHEPLRVRLPQDIAHPAPAAGPGAAAGFRRDLAAVVLLPQVALALAELDQGHDLAFAGSVIHGPMPSGQRSSSGLPPLLPLLLPPLRLLLQRQQPVSLAPLVGHGVEVGGHVIACEQG
jgi:hypothetical protein